MDSPRYCLTEKDGESGNHLLPLDVAKLAGVSTAAVKAAIKEGRLKAAHITPGSRVNIIHRDEAERWVNVRAEVKSLSVRIVDAWRGK